MVEIRIREIFSRIGKHDLLETGKSSLSLRSRCFLPDKIQEKFFDFNLGLPYLMRQNSGQNRSLF